MDELHDEIALRRFYLHPNRWTSLGLSLLDAMHAGMPVVALGATEAARSVPREAGIVSTDLEELEDAMRTYLSDADEAVAAGRLARVYALEHHGLSRFLQDWDAVLREWTSGQAPNERLSARTALLAGSSSS
jgi:glycosyltransferase involved in cell wall biosynthesis